MKSGWDCSGSKAARLAPLACGVLLSGFLALSGTVESSAQIQGQVGQTVSNGCLPFTETFRATQFRNFQRTPLPEHRAPSNRTPLKEEPRLPGAQEQGQPRPQIDLPPRQSVRASFQGISLQDYIDQTNGTIRPPDTMGAIGPDHYVQAMNTGVAIYDRAGTRLAFVTLGSFFAQVVNNVTLPDRSVFDPRVLFDHRTGRWIAICEDSRPSPEKNRLYLAISRTGDAMGVWDKYFFEIGEPGVFSDYPTLGVDDNGIYIGVSKFGDDGYIGNRILATRKASLFAANPSLGAVTAFDDQPEMFTAQPAVSFDATAADQPAWILSTHTTLVEDVFARTITWTAGGPVLSPRMVIETDPYTFFSTVPAQGSTTQVNTVGDRLMMAVKRDGRIWTTRAVGCSSTGQATSADRLAAEWFTLDVRSGTPAVEQTGRVFDPSASTPRHYYFPSIMVNGAGQAALSFSGSASDEFIGVYACSRLSADPPGAMGAVVQVKAGEAAYTRVSQSDTRNRWGDYSYTTLDPRDGLSIWTTQQYAEALGTSFGGSTSRYGTWVAELRAPAPAVTQAKLDVLQKTTGAELLVQGSGFYDGGAGSPHRMTAAFSGSGITNVRVAQESAGTLRVRFDVAQSAAPGVRSLTVQNPDGQPATFDGALEVCKRLTTSKGKLKLTPGATLAFANTTVGQTANVTLRLENTGRDPLAVKPGTLRAPFALSGLLREVCLKPGAENAVTATVTFTPTTTAQKQATLKFTTNAKPNSKSLTVKGRGI